jgi:hypothetical protein
MSKHHASPHTNPRGNSLNTNPTLPDSINSDASETDAPDSLENPVNKGDGPLPAELTGRATSTGEDLVSLMANGSAEHMTDGFRSGNGDDPETDADADDDEEVDLT